MTRVDGKVAVVTGAGSGIGQALAIELARRGASLAVSDVSEDGLAQTVDAVKTIGAQVHADRLDIADRAAVAAYAAAVAEHYGVVHQLYNNAGIAGGGSVVDADYDVYDRVLAVNLGGVINGTKEFLPHLIASGDGHLVNISSLNGIMGQADLSAYCASKFAVRGFTESLRAEMVRDKRPVRVTVVHPGGVATNIADVTPPDADPAQAAHHARRTRVYKEKLLKMPAPTAAAIIVDGVEAGKSRVLVGNDAKGMDLMVRVIPRWYPRVMAWWDRRVFGSD